MSLAKYLSVEDGRLLQKIEKCLLEDSPKSESTLQPTTWWKGHVMQPSFPADVVEYVYEHWKPANEDVLLASFPKTGTTWMREILRLILYSKNEKEKEISRHCSIHLQYLEMGPCEKYKIFDNLPLSRRIFVSHLPTEILNTNVFEAHKNKIVYIYRNPRDECVSMFHHFANLSGPRPTYRNGVAISSDWNTFFQQYIKGEIAMAMKPGDGYIEYHAQWLQYAQGNDNVFVVAYENLIKNFEWEVKQLSIFLNIDISDAEVRDIQKSCALSTMYKSSQSGDMTIDEKLRTKFGLVRKGQIGEWKSHFSNEQVIQMEEKVKKILPQNFNFVYEKPECNDAACIAV